MAKSEEREAELRHARLSNMRGVVPSLSGQHYKVHASKANSHEKAESMKKEKVEHSAKSKALEGMKHESLNAWGQDAKTAKEVRKHLSQAKKMKSFNKHAGERFNSGY